MNLDFCPNKASKEFKEMSSIFGEDKAYFLWMRNNGNHLEKAPNGADSKLFSDLLLYFKGDRKEALRAKANVYRNEFLNWFGDWGGFKTTSTKSNLFTSTGEINWNYFELLLDLYHNNQPDSMFSHGRYTLATRPENHFTEEKNTLNHIKFVTQSMLNLLEGKYDMDLPFVSEARASMQNQKDLMILAAMFHDAAKPYRHGDIHGWESADILRDLLGIDYDNRVAEWAVRHHMPMPFSHKAEFSLSNPEAIEVAKNIARDAKRVGIDANTAINAFVLINAADVINGRELDVDDNWAKKAGEEGLKKYGGDISVKNVLSVELKEKVALLKKAFDEIKDEDFGDTAYNYSHQERFDYNAFPEGGREDKKLPYLNNTEYNNVSKVVDENGEPLVVWHGGAPDINTFRHSEDGSSTTGTGYYVDPNTGEHIPVDSERTMFFSSNRYTAESYRDLYGINKFSEIYSKVDLLIEYFADPNWFFKESGDGKRFKLLFKNPNKDLIDLLDELSVFNPRFKRLKDYYIEVTSKNKKLNDKEKSAFRDMLVEVRRTLRDYTESWLMNRSDWLNNFGKTKNIVSRYNNPEGIEKLLSGEIPSELLEEYQIYKLIEKYREKVGLDKIANYEHVSVSASNTYYEGFLYDGNKLYIFSPTGTGLHPVENMNKDLLKQYLDSFDVEATNAENRMRNEEVYQRVSSKGGLYPTFLNIKNPLSHDYEGTQQGLGYKQNQKYPFGYVAARQVNKAIKSGNDGVIYYNLYDPYLANNYGVFDPNQIKSAVANSGEFSKTNNNIYKESFNQKETEFFVKDTFLKQAYDDRLHKDKHLSIDDVLSYLSKSNTTASVVNLINFINKEKNNGLIPLKLSIRVVSGIDMAWTVGNILQGRRACYDADRLTIYIDADAYYENGDSANVILHEIMHAITLNLLNNNPEVRAKLESTLETYRKYYPLLYLRMDNHSLAEFVADIWTNPLTIKRLLSIPYKSESLFDRILNILRQLLKPFFKEGTLSEKASKELVELLESTPTMRSGSSGIYYAPAPTVDQIQKEYDAISDKIRKLFSDLYRRFDKMPNKSATRRRTLTEIFKTIQRLKNELSEKAIEIALETAAELLGVINRATGAPQSNNNLYAWFINLELKDDPYENITPQLILDIYKHQIGFYRSILASIPDDASILLNPTTRLNRQDVLNLLNVIENFWKHAVEMIGEREIDNMIDSFTGLAIPQELKENMKVVYRDWLHKNWFHGDITSVTSLFTSYGQSGNPIVKIAFHLTQYAELKTQEEMLATCVPILEKFLKVNSLSSWVKPGWQKVFLEVNRDGVPTGKWVRDINYGQYELDLNKFVKQLNEHYDNIYGHHYIYDELGMVRNSVTGVYVEDEEWENGVAPAYVNYLLDLYNWKCSNANLRYTFDYYAERLSRPYDEVDYPEGHGLSLKTLQLYENILNTINYYLGLCTDENGIPHPELPKDRGGLTNAERAELDRAKDELKKISSPFEEDGTPKVDEEYQMAMEIQTWQKFVLNKQHGSDINWATFYAAEAEAQKAANDTGDPSILANFYKYNSEVRIDPDFLESIFGVSEDISPADIIIKKIYQKCLENLTKIKDNVYTRDIEPFKNNTAFWLNYRLIVQDVADGKDSDTLVDPWEEFDDVAYYYNIPYTDSNGNLYDIFGNLATSATPQTDLLTWHSYIINHYKDIAILNNGIIPGVEDEYGNPIIFLGSDMQIVDLIKRTMFSYEATWFDKKGAMHTELRPLPMFTMLMPRDQKYIKNIPTGSRFSQPKQSAFKNPDFVESSGISELPKRDYYDNAEAYNKITKNNTVKLLYDACIQCMKDMQRVMGFNNRTFNYKLPMLNADSVALASRGSFGAIFRSSQEVLNDDTDMRNIDAGIRNADGTIDFDIPLRLLQDLKDMRNLSSDVIQSVMLYVQMAYNYRNKKAIQDTLQTIHDNLTPNVRSRTATDYDRFKDNPTDMTEAIDDENSLTQYEAMMDSTMYGMDTGKSSKAHKEATKQEIFWRKFGNVAVRAEAVATLGLNLLSMFAGSYDSITKMLRESIMNRYMSFIDLSKSFLYVHAILWKVLANIGNPLANCKIVAMMQLNGLSKDYSKLFDNINHNRIIRTASNLIMGGFSMFDYFSNMVMLRAHYRNVRFYDGDVIPKGFYTAYEMRQAFKAAGKSWKLGALAHSLCKTSLWSVYKFKNHKAVVKDGYISKAEAAKAASGGIGLKWSDFVTDKVKTDIRSKSLQRSSLYNGMAPDNDRARYLKTVWGKIIFAMRNWYQMVLQRSLVGTDDTSVRKVVDTNTEQIRFGKSVFKPGKKVEALTEEQSANRMGWNFETNAPQEEIAKSTYRALVKIYRMLKSALCLKLGKFKDIKLSNVEKYGIRGAIIQLLYVQLLFASFIPIMNNAQEIPMPDNKRDAELSVRNVINNLSKYPILWWANAHIRAYESNVAEINPLEPKNFIKTSSALMGALDKQTSMIDMVQEGAGLSTHTLDEEISTGSKYKYYTRGERYFRQSIGPWNNMITSLTIPGIKYNTQWYMNMYGDRYRQMGYDFSISAGNQSASNRPHIDRPKIERPKIERPKINRPGR